MELSAADLDAVAIAGRQDVGQLMPLNAGDRLLAGAERVRNVAERHDLKPRLQFN